MLESLGDLESATAEASREAAIMGKIYLTRRIQKEIEREKKCKGLRKRAMTLRRHSDKTKTR